MPTLDHFLLRLAILFLFHLSHNLLDTNFLVTLMIRSQKYPTNVNPTHSCSEISSKRQLRPEKSH